MSIISPELTNLEAALHYANLNYKVFPVHGFLNGACTCCKNPCPQGSKPGKHPACTHGYKDASVDQGQITLWFSGQPWLNVGIALGEDQLGVDVDPRHGGMATLEAWEREHGPLPKTPKVLTGSKGHHMYFKLPAGVVVKSKSGWAPGIDTRSLGGYLVAPPSLHECGRRYEWLEPLDTPLALAPDWLLKIVSEKPVSTSRTSSMGFGIVKDDGPCDFSTHPGAPEGKRHQELLRLAGIHLARGDSMASIEAMAVRWGERCSPKCEPDGVLQKVRGLAKRDASKRDRKGGEKMDSELVALGSGMERMEVKPRSPAIGDLPSIPFQDSVSKEPESKPEAGGEAPNHQSSSPFPSTPEPEHGLCLMKKDFADEPTPGLPEGGRGDYACSQVPQAKSRGLSFGLVAQEGAQAGGVALSLRCRGATAKALCELDEPAVEFEPEPEAESFTYTVDTANIEAPEDWPTLGPEAYHGLMGSIVKAVAPETEADPTALLLSLATAVGSSVGKGPHFALASGVHHANLFSSIVGDTASGKGQSWGVVHKLMAKADPEWESSSIAYGLSSGEGLVDRVKDSEEPQDPQVFGSISEAKRLLCVETEFAKPITAMRREGNTLSPLLRSAWDGLTLEVLTRGKSKLRASNAHVSVLAHITPDELAKLLSQSVEVANGFANRFLWALARRSNVLPEGGDPFVLEPFHEPLGAALAKAKNIGRVVRDDGAKALWASVYEGLTAPRPGAYGMAVGRGHAQTLRLSLIYALMDGSEFVKVEHLKAALALWAYCEQSARIIFKDGAKEGTERGRRDGEDEPLDFKLLLLIEKNPGVKRTDLVQAIPSNKRGLVGEALAGLQEKGLAHPKMGATTGRKAECWYPGPMPEGPDDGEGHEPLAVGRNGWNGMEDKSPAMSFGLVVAAECWNGMEGKPPTQGADPLPSIPSRTPEHGMEAPTPLTSIPCHSFQPKSDGTKVDATPLTSIPCQHSTSITHEPTVLIMSTVDAEAPEPQREAKLPTTPPLPILSEQELRVQAESVAICEADFFSDLHDAKPTLQAEALNLEEFEREMNAIEPCGIDLPIARSKPQASTHGAEYGLGKRVRTRLTPEPLTIVEVKKHMIGPQYYILEHEDASWRPLDNFRVAGNSDRLRIIASMEDIVEVIVESNHPSPSQGDIHLQNSLYVDS